MEEDEAGDFHDVHLHPLQSQGSIYTLSKLLPSSQRDEKSSSNQEDEEHKDRQVFILTSTLNRRSFALQCSSSPPLNLPRITSKEIHFTYIPSGAEVISIDAFRREELNDYVVGITIIIKSSSNNEAGNSNSNTNSGVGGQFFNIYNDDTPIEESLTHNCQSLELDFIPYQLTHAPCEGPSSSKIWLLSGSDSHIHPYAYEPEGQVYNQIPLRDCFPELEEMDESANVPLSIIQWLEIVYFEEKDVLYRLAATGREDGRLRVTKMNVSESILESSWVHEAMENPICSLKFFKSVNCEIVPKIFEGYVSTPIRNWEWNLVVVHALSEAKVFTSITSKGLSQFEFLKNSHSYDVPTSVLIADVDFDGNSEILIGTYGQVIITYGKRESEWERRKLSLSARRFPAPILNLDYIDLSGDGIRDLVVMTTKGLHILQLDRSRVLKTLKKRLESILTQGSLER